jgi:hypothetical protein
LTSLLSEMNGWNGVADGGGSLRTRIDGARQ